jgi:hypothetical protein
MPVAKKFDDAWYIQNLILFANAISEHIKLQLFETVFLEEGFFVVGSSPSMVIWNSLKIHIQTALLSNLKLACQARLAKELKITLQTVSNEAYVQITQDKSIYPLLLILLNLGMVKHSIAQHKMLLLTEDAFS